MSVQYEHLHTILYNPFFIGICVSVRVGQCEHSIKPLQGWSNFVGWWLSKIHCCLKTMLMVTTCSITYHLGSCLLCEKSAHPWLWCTMRKMVFSAFASSPSLPFSISIRHRSLESPVPFYNKIDNMYSFLHCSLLSFLPPANEGGVGLCLKDQSGQSPPLHTHTHTHRDSAIVHLMAATAVGGTHPAGMHSCFYQQNGVNNNAWSLRVHMLKLDHDFDWYEVCDGNTYRSVAGDLSMFLGDWCLFCMAM